MACFPKISYWFAHRSYLTYLSTAIDGREVTLGGLSSAGTQSLSGTPDSSGPIPVMMEAVCHSFNHVAPSSDLINLSLVH